MIIEYTRPRTQNERDMVVIFAKLINQQTVAALDGKKASMPEYLTKNKHRRL